MRISDWSSDVCSSDLWGGAAGKEPEDYLKRDAYTHSTAQEAVLRKSVEIVGGDAKRFDHVELYSCFPVVPKMALRTLGLDASSCTPTVAGGLTFFGGPLNNYMSHAVCALVRTLRPAPQAIGQIGRASCRDNVCQYVY